MVAAALKCALSACMIGTLALPAWAEEPQPAGTANHEARSETVAFPDAAQDAASAPQGAQDGASENAGTLAEDTGGAPSEGHAETGGEGGGNAPDVPGAAAGATEGEAPASGETDAGAVGYEAVPGAYAPASVGEGDGRPADGDPVVAIVDTGCDPSLCIDAVSVIGGDGGDPNGHGTSVALWVLSQNPDARILSVQALGSDGKARDRDIALGIDYAVAAGASIVNLSFSAHSPQGNGLVDAAVGRAVASGCTVVAAAGNDGADASEYSPGNNPDAVCVGALAIGGDVLGSSNRGEAVDVWEAAASTSYAAAIVSGKLSRMAHVRISNLQEAIASTGGDGETMYGAAFTHAALQLRLHISNIGDSQWMVSQPRTTADTVMTSTSFGHYANGDWQRIENVALKVVQNNAASGGITYRCYYRGTGYDAWRSNGTYSPTATGKGMAVEGVEMKLTGTLASCYDLYYYVETFLWRYDGTESPVGHQYITKSNGQYAGTKDQSTAIDYVSAWLVPKSYSHVVQVRYQNADGSYGSYSNARSGTYAYGATVPAWSRAQDATYNAASMAAYTAGYAATTKQVSVTRRTATNTIQARYQNADGSWGAYSNVSSGTDRVGQVRSWSRAQDATYNAASASITGTASAQTKQVSVSRRSYTASFDSQGGSDVRQFSFLAGSPLPALGEPAREGYAFAGWWTAPEGGTRVSAGDAAPASDVTYYAHWERTVQLPAAGGGGSAGWFAGASTMLALAAAGFAGRCKERRSQKAIARQSEL